MKKTVVEKKQNLTPHSRLQASMPEGCAHPMSCAGACARLSATQRQIYDTIAQSTTPMSAYDILAILSRSKNTAPPTVYRALAALQEQGLVHRLESMNAYTLCHHKHAAGACFFMICEKCQRTEERDVSPSILADVDEILRQAAFVPHKITFEIAGLCQACSALV